MPCSAIRTKSRARIAAYDQRAADWDYLVSPARYATPLLHLLAALATLALLRRGRVYVAAAAAQAALLAAAAGGGRSRSRPLLVARYYVLTTAALAAGLYDWARHGTPAGWDAPEGTR